MVILLVNGRWNVLQKWSFYWICFVRKVSMSCIPKFSPKVVPSNLETSPSIAHFH